MSSVSNCILSFSVLEDIPARIIAVNAVLSPQSFVSIEDESLPKGWYGGSKMLETALLVGAFNYFPEDEFMGWLKTINWRCPEEVQLIIKRDDDLLFEIRSIV